MKATGVVRRIDDLGRVVIPKEIRKVHRIKEGDPLEIFTDKEGEIILKKYSPIGELTEFASTYADTISKTTGHIACITDKDMVIAVSGGSKKDFLEKGLSKELEEVLENKEVFKSIHTRAYSKDRACLWTLGSHFRQAVSWRGLLWLFTTTCFHHFFHQLASILA